MRTIRRGVFETNSSSTHSISISNREVVNCALLPDADGFIYSQFGEFGWGYETFTSSRSRLEYALTMVAMTEGKNISYPDDFYNLEGYKTINEAVIRNCGCIAVHLNSIGKSGSYEYKGETCHYFNFDGYIDHQSCEDYHSLNDFLHDIECTIDEFLFGKDVMIICDNDNRCDYGE